MSVTSRFISVLCGSALVGAVLAGAAQGEVRIFQYTPFNQTFYVNQQFPSGHDNCYDYGIWQITDNVHNHPSGTLGRSAIIRRSDGAWLRSTADTNPDTWASLGGAYQSTVKRGMSKNISSATYTGNGRVFTEDGASCV